MVMTEENKKRDSVKSGLYSSQWSNSGIGGMYRVKIYSGSILDFCG